MQIKLKVVTVSLSGKEHVLNKYIGFLFMVLFMFCVGGIGFGVISVILSFFMVNINNVVVITVMLTFSIPWFVFVLIPSKYVSESETSNNKIQKTTEKRFTNSFLKHCNTVLSYIFIILMSSFLILYVLVFLLNLTSPILNLIVTILVIPMIFCVVMIGIIVLITEINSEQE